MAWQDQLDDLIGGDGAQPVGDNQPYKFFPQGRDQWYAPQGGRPLGVGRGTADPEMRKYMMNMPSMNQLRSRTGINFPEQSQPDESGRRSMPLTPQIQEQLQKSGDFERMMPYAPKPKPEDIEKIPMSQDQPKVWEAQLDDMLGGDGANHVPQSTWRTMLDNLSFIGTAEAAPMQRVQGGERERGPGFYPGEWPQVGDDDDQMDIRSDATPIPKSPTEDRPQLLPNAYPNLPQSREARGARPHPPTQAPTPAPGETPPADNRIGSTREDGAMWDGSRWVSQQEQAQQARESAAAKTSRKETRRQRQDITPPERKAPEGYEPLKGFKGPEGSWRAGLERLIEPETGMAPFSTLPQTWRNLKRAGGEIWQGAKQIYGETDEEGQTHRARGAANVAAGAIGIPWAAPKSIIDTTVGIPLEKATGMPRESTEFIVGGIGAAGLPASALSKVPGFTAAQRLTAPETISAEARDAAASIRKWTGITERDAAQTQERLMKYYPEVAAADPATKTGLQKYLDGEQAFAPTDPEMKQLADVMRRDFEGAKANLQGTNKYAQAAFRDDFFAHYWQDPEAAKAFVQKYQTGGYGHLKERTYPTITDGLNAGLKLKYENPIEAAMVYHNDIKRVLAKESVLDEAMGMGHVVDDAGLARWMAKGGTPMSELKGVGGRKLYAPEAFADVFNAWTSQGIQGAWGTAFEGLRKFTNFNTQMLLGLSGYHAMTMAEAAWSTQMARALRNPSSVKNWLEIPVAPITYAAKGKQVKDMYLGEKAVSNVVDQEIMDLYTEAGGRGAGTKHALDYASNQYGSFIKSFNKAGGRLYQPSTYGAGLREIGREYRQGFQEMQGKYGPIRGGVAGTAGAVLSTVGRAMQTVQRPLFERWIPNLKNGAYRGMMKDFLEANPAATRAEKLAYARKAVDEVDNRFGEMIHDNIFWNRIAKQIAMASMVSYSWNLGGARVLGGGVRDITKFATGHGDFTDKAAYLTAMTANWVFMNTMAQKIKTGQYPWETDTPFTDMVSARTGGTKKVYRKDDNEGMYGHGGWEDAPERMLTPGLFKDIWQSDMHGLGEIGNKLNNGMKSIWSGVATQMDYKGDPIGDKDAGWLKNALEYAFEQMTPITVQNIFKPKAAGSNIGRVGGTDPTTGRPRSIGQSILGAAENVLGMREAPALFQNPHYRRNEELRREKAYESRDAKERARRKRNQEYGGPQ